MLEAGFGISLPGFGQERGILRHLTHGTRAHSDVIGSFDAVPTETIAGAISLIQAGIAFLYHGFLIFGSLAEVAGLLRIMESRPERAPYMFAVCGITRTLHVAC